MKTKEEILASLASWEAPVYSRRDVHRLAETIVEITSCLTPEFWDAMAGERLSVAQDVANLAEAVERVAVADGIEWDIEHDFFLFTECLADAYQHYATSEDGGLVAGLDDVADRLVRQALRAEKIEV